MQKSKRVRPTIDTKGVGKKKYKSTTMKTIKTLITLLLMFVGMTATAQTVVIEKYDGTSDEYQLAEVDSVVYEPGEETIIGYYSFNATDDAGMKALTEADFTPITSKTGITTKPKNGGKTVIITESANAPTMKFYLGSMGYANPITMKAGDDDTDKTKTINGKTYYLWYDYTTIVENHTHVHYTIN